jgi:hypothetical protein
MGLAFATRNPTEGDTLALRLLLSCYRDGSGAEKEKDGSTRANWRQIERCIADLFDVETNENKNIFDLCAPDEKSASVYYGFSVKSKQLTLKNIKGLDDGERVYMEIANSPAKFWDALKNKLKIDETDFTSQRRADEIGSTVLETVKSWHHEGKKNFEKENPGTTLDLESSVYLCLSYSKIDDQGNRLYQVHAFSLDYPKGIEWKFTSSKCLTGFDPDEPEERIIDWYALSGGQLKYYPKGSQAVWKTKTFLLEAPPNVTPADKVRSYFPQHEKKLQGIKIFKC